MASKAKKGPGGLGQKPPGGPPGTQTGGPGNSQTGQNNQGQGNKKVCKYFKITWFSFGL